MSRKISRADREAVAKIAYDAFANQSLTSRAWASHVATELLESDWLANRDRKAFLFGWDLGWEAREAYDAKEREAEVPEVGAGESPLARTMLRYIARRPRPDSTYNGGAR